jgi:FemAB-related protein (PEP-CTERM system-associated)
MADAAPLGVEVLDLADARAVAAHDAFVRARTDSTPFHLSGWARAIRRALGHQPYLLAARGAGGGIAGVLPLTHVRHPLFGQNLVSTGFAVYGGPLADGAQAHVALDAAAWALAQRLGVKSLEYRNQARLRPDWPAKSDVYATFKRPIEATTEANLKAIPRKQRADVRKAIDSALEVRIGATPADLADHFAVYAASVRNLGTPVFPPALFSAVAAEFGADADVLTVRHAGRPVASVFSLYHGDTVLPYWGGGTAEAVPSRANLMMYWALIEHGRARGLGVFDFGRSKSGTGPFAFKKNWGFEPSPLHYEFRLAEGAAMPDLNPNSPKYRAMTRAWARLPLWLANRIGPPLARGLG